MHPLWFYKHQHDNRIRSTQNAFSLLFAAILVNCAQSGEIHNYCTPHIITENFENFLIHRCNYILLSQVYYVWQVVKTPTIILNNPVVYCAYNVDTRHPKLYHITTVHYLLTTSVTECWYAVLSTPDPQSRGLKLECESCLSKSGFYGFPRFIFSNVRPIKLIHNRVQPFAFAVPLSHFS